MIRIAVSDLDSWRYWAADDESGLDELLARLRKTAEPTSQMLAGRAFARLMEIAPQGEVQALEIDGWRFIFAIDEEIALPPVRELKGEMVFQTPSGPVTLVGKVDGLDGAVRDQKLTERLDVERYYVDSLQWRCYLLMFGAEKFVYDVFTAKYHENYVTITAYDPVPFYAYPGMREDVQRAVEAVAEIVAKHCPEKVNP